MLADARRCSYLELGLPVVSSKAVMIKQCNAITTKNEFSFYRKSRENKDEKNWIGKINNITKKPSRGSFVKQTVGTVYLT